MIRAFAAAALVLGSLTLSGLHSFRQGLTVPTPLPQTGPGCVNVFVNEPLVVFDVSGYGLAGLIHQHLAVYSSGLASISAAGGGTVMFPFGSQADVTYVPVDEARKLWNAVVQAGAMNLCDFQENVSDAPLTTVTVHRGETDSRAHTYSYYIASTPALNAVEQHIRTFIQANFPGY